jgi:DNA-binding PadR family transcriptional regulator
MGQHLPSMSATELLIMDLLEQGECFGLQLVAAGGGALKRSSIYVLLTRMESKGFVTSRLEDRPPGASGLPRRLYTPTPYGLKVRDALRALQAALALRPVEARS